MEELLQPTPEGDDVLYAGLLERCLPPLPHQTDEDGEVEGHWDGEATDGSGAEPEGGGSC